MIDWLHGRAQATPHAPALRIDAHEWDYAALNEFVNRACARLHTVDIPANKRVGILRPNGRVYVGLVHALARMGCCAVTLNTRLTAAELNHQLAHTDCRLVITTADAPDLTVPTVTITAAEIEAIPPAPHQPTEWPPDRMQAIVFTSGTSGAPKAVPITFGQHFNSALASAYRLGHRPDNLWLSCLPLYHVGGLAVLFRSCLYGTAVDLHPRFDLTAVNHALDHKPITLISVVPTMLYRLLDSRDQWPDSLRLILVGGAAATADLVRRANRLSPDRPLVATTYGMTEAASQIATQRPDDTARKPGSVGRPLLFTDLKIVDDEGGLCTAEQVGDIWVRGRTLTAGYLRNPAVNAQRFVDGWFHTGDLGYVDEDGDLWIVQRRSDLIVSGGENVFPAEVERVLETHPAVVAACVVGVPDAEWGQTVAALVQPVADHTPTAVQLVAHARQTLAGYKLPRLIRFTDQLPQTAGGKIARSTVADTMRKAAVGE